VHPHREVLPLDAAGADLGEVGFSVLDALVGADPDWRSVPAAARVLGLVALDDLRPVNLVGLEGQADDALVGLVSIRAQLDTGRDTALQVFDERPAIVERPVSDEPGRDELRAGAERDPRPNVAVAERRPGASFMLNIMRERSDRTTVALDLIAV
jgi:hypothetical protein